MDLATVIGIFGGLAVMVFSVLMAGSSFAAFVDYPSVICVVGGALAAVLVCAPAASIFNLARVARKAFFHRTDEIPELIDQIVSMAETARRDGLLALENRLGEIENPFIVLGIQMAVDGTRPEVIDDVLRTQMEAVSARHRDGKLLLDQFGKYAPAFGMIGTLIGLVIMLGNMDDPGAIGPGMAVALLTTLYGAVIANVVCLPLAEKLGHLNRQELQTMEIILRGILAIQSGDNPRIIEQKLSTFVPPRSRAGAQEQAA
jgi:chemotaxis protein MotA